MTTGSSSSRNFDPIAFFYSIYNSLVVIFTPITNLFSIPKDVNLLFNSFLYLMKVIMLLIFLFLVAVGISWFMHLDPRQQIILWTYLAIILSVQFLAQYGMMPCADLPKKEGGNCAGGFETLMSIRPPDKAKYRDKFITKYLTPGFPEVGETILSIGLSNIFFIIFIIIIKGPWWKLLSNPKDREIEDSFDEITDVKEKVNELEKNSDEVKSIKNQIANFINRRSQKRMIREKLKK